MGLASPKQAPIPPNYNMKHYKTVMFVQFQNVKPHCTNVKPS